MPRLSCGSGEGPRECQASRYEFLIFSPSVAPSSRSWIWRVLRWLRLIALLISEVLFQKLRFNPDTLRGQREVHFVMVQPEFCTFRDFLIVRYKRSILGVKALTR